MTHLAFAAPSIAAQQRITVGPQLKAMREGSPPILFQVVGDLLVEIRRSLPVPVTLLDAGCGSAYYSEVIEHFVPGYCTYTGADYNPGMVALARCHYPSLAIHRADLCSLGFADCSFDIVLSGACIGHIPEWTVALLELMRITVSYLILHRNPIWLDGTATTFKFRNDYGAGIWVHRFNERDLLSRVLGDFEVLATRDLHPPRAREVTRTYLLRRKT